MYFRRQPIAWSIPVLILVLMLSACSSYFQAAEEMNENSIDDSISDQQIEEIVQEWRETKPAIRRLSELESDFMLVLSEIEKLSVIPDAPDGYRSEQELEIVADETSKRLSDNFQKLPEKAAGRWEMPGMSDNDAPSKQTTATQPAAEDTLQRQRYAVHIALFLQENTAHVGWKVLNRRYDALFSGLQPLLEKIEYPQQQLYSLRVGPFSEQKEAYRFCSVLKRRKYQCKLTDYTGTPIS